MKHLTLFLLAVFTTVLFCSGAPYDDSRRTFLIDSLSSELSVARTYSDSVSILYDLFDLRTRGKKGIDGMKLLHLSRNHGDERTELDIARRLASATASYDTIICNNLREYVKALPPSRDRDATDLFIKLTEMRARASNSDEEGRQRKLNEYIERYRTSHNLTPTEEVEMLFVICTFMTVKNIERVNIRFKVANTLRLVNDSNASTKGGANNITFELVSEEGSSSGGNSGGGNSGGDGGIEDDPLG